MLAEPIEYDSDENFLEFIGPDQDEANHSMEEDEALLDEGDEDDDGGDEHGEGEGDEETGGEYEDRRGKHGSGQDGVGEVGVAGADGEGSAVATADSHDAAAAAGPAAAADLAAEPVVGNADVVAADGGEPGTEGGYSGQEGGEVPGNDVGERRDGEAAWLSDGDFEEDDLVLEDEGEDELDSKLKPDHRFFAVRALVEGGKTARKLNRRLKVQAGKDDGFLVKGDERFFRNFNDSSIERRVNMSASFQYNGTCLNGPHDAWQGRNESCESRRQTISSISRPTFREI